ncbi:MAG: LuxR family transcriptional regulator [Zetaproteobacteria bacterium]|nr:MAG: LuxR family transcriptional regulator [Zetaproteobacteria bacterium]
MSISFRGFVESTASVSTAEELVNIFLKEIAKLGYDRMAFCLLSNHNNLGLKAGVGYINNYPDDWLSHYFENDFDRFDPVLTYGRQNLGTFSWDEMEGKMSMTKKQKVCLNLGSEAKLFNGTFTPLWGPHRFAGVSLASTEKTDACHYDAKTRDIITAYCNHFYLVFQRLQQVTKIKNEEYDNLFLSFLEKEVLTWAAQGKSDNDIADIMTISSFTVNYHFRNIFKKLKSNNRIVAISKAISLGLIHT